MHCPLLWLIYTSFTLLPPGYCYTHTYTLEKKQSDHHKTPQDCHMLKVSACKQSIINFTMATSHHCITKHLLLHSHHLKPHPWHNYQLYYEQGMQTRRRSKSVIGFEWFTSYSTRQDVSNRIKFLEAKYLQARDARGEWETWVRILARC